MFVSGGTLLDPVTGKVKKDEGESGSLTSFEELERSTFVSKR